MNILRKHQSVMIQERIITDVVKDKASYTVLAIYNFLVARRNNITRSTEASYNFIERALNVSQPTLFKALRFLRKHGYVYTIRRGNSPNVYLMPLEDFVLCADNKTDDLWDNYLKTIESFGGDANDFYAYNNSYVVPVWDKLKGKVA